MTIDIPTGLFQIRRPASNDRTHAAWRNKKKMQRGDAPPATNVRRNSDGPIKKKRDSRQPTRNLITEMYLESVILGSQPLDSMTADNFQHFPIICQTEQDLLEMAWVIS
jgi:hypothetical protein